MKDFIRTCVKMKEVHVNPNSISSAIGNAIDTKIKKDMEGVCCEDGYILKDSIEIIERSMGKIINVNNQSKITYTIKYKCSIINPSEGMDIDCYINSVTKMGAVAYIKYNNITEFKDSPLLIIIPKTYSPEADNLEVNKKFKIKILATRLKYRSNQIHVVAKLV